MATRSSLLAGLALLSGLTFPLSPSVRSAETRIFVAPDGNDAWSGRIAEANAARNDGPLATPQRARDAVRAMKRTGDDSGPIRVILRGGTYSLSEPLVLTPADSGSEDRPVIWCAFNGETPVLSGGRKVTGWSKTVVNGHDAWVAALPGGPSGPAIRELWLDGHRLTRARWPKQGTLAVDGPSDAGKQDEWSRGVTEFRFAPEDIRPWPSASDGEVVVTCRWVESHLPIQSIDASNRVIRFSKRSVFRLEPGDRYWIENVMENLTAPGEFFVDAKARTVTLITPNGVDPNQAEVVAPQLAQVLRMIGKPEAGEFVSHVQFRGLEFAHAEWYFDHAFIGQQDASDAAGREWSFKPDPTRSGFSQAAIGVPGAVWGRGVRACSFEGCTIAHVGTYGIELGQACQGNRISRCTLTDLGAGGVKIGEVAVRDDASLRTSDNKVSDCTIADGGNLFPSCVAVWIGQSPGNTIAHNEIHGFWYTGVSIGWTWGYGKSTAERNRLEYNRIHHIGMKSDADKPILSDMAGVYTLGNHEGTVIRNNVFHDVAALKYGGWGIYFDEGTTRILAENNLVYRTTHGGFHQHYGKENTFRNNIIAFGRDAQIQRTRIEDHLSFRFERNVVYWDHGPLFAGDWKKPQVAFDENTYWRTEPGEIRFGQQSWAEWRNAGMDRNSKIADPHFNNPAKGDFTFSAGSHEAFAGFVPFDVSTVGPR